MRELEVGEIEMSNRAGWEKRGPQAALCTLCCAGGVDGARVEVRRGLQPLLHGTKTLSSQLADVQSRQQ